MQYLQSLKRCLCGIMSFMDFLECALCGKSDPWYVMTANSSCDLPLQMGDLLCPKCAETVPKSIQANLIWVSTFKRDQYLAGDIKP